MEADFHTLLMFSWHFQMLKRFNVIIRPTITLLARPVARGGGREGASPPLEIISPPLESAGLLFFFFSWAFFLSACHTIVCNLLR